VTKGRKQILVTNVPEWLTDRLRVASEGSSANDVCVQVLAERYGLPFQSMNRKSGKTLGAGRLALKVPEDVWVAVKAEAHPFGYLSEVVLNALVEHFRRGVVDASTN
jgi:hypothetical protein